MLYLPSSTEKMLRGLSLLHSPLHYAPDVLPYLRLGENAQRGHDIAFPFSLP